MFRLRARAGVVLSVLALASAPLFLLVTTSEVAGAAEFVVDNAGDSGAGTLRQAMLDAQAGTDNVITVVPGPRHDHPRERPRRSTRTPTSPSTATASCVNGNGSDGVHPRSSGDGNLTIDGMIAHRREQRPPATMPARCVKDGNDGDVTLTNCSMSGNTVTGGNSTDAARSSSLSGGTTMSGCIVTGNTLSTAGRRRRPGLSISIGGALNVTNSDVSGNTVTVGQRQCRGRRHRQRGRASHGRQLVHHRQHRDVRISADRRRARSPTEGGTLTIINSTISGNT